MEPKRGSVAGAPRSMGSGRSEADWNQAPSATPTLAPSGGWQEQAWCQPASPTWQEQAWCQPASPTWVQAPSATPKLAPSSDWQRQPWCQPASQNQWQGSGWGWTNYSDNGWKDLKESNSYYGYYANGYANGAPAGAAAAAVKPRRGEGRGRVGSGGLRCGSAAAAGQPRRRHDRIAGPGRCLLHSFASGSRRATRRDCGAQQHGWHAAAAD